MGAWDTILKYGGKAMKGMGKAANATGKSAGHAVLHPSQTLRGAGQAVKTATRKINKLLHNNHSHRVEFNDSSVRP